MARKIGFLGNITKAILQVEISEEQADFVCFLWFKRINETLHQITSFRFTCVAFSLTSHPLLLNGTMKIHVSKYLPVPDYTNNVKRLTFSIFVDE